MQKIVTLFWFCPSYHSPIHGALHVAAAKQQSGRYVPMQYRTVLPAFAAVPTRIQNANYVTTV